MMEKSYFIADVTKDENEKERVVIKYYSGVLQSLRVHKVTAFLEKYPKTTYKNLKIANSIVGFLNYIQEKIDSKEIRSLEFISIKDGSDYIDRIKNDVTHADLNAFKRLLTKFMYFLAKNQMLIKIKKSDFLFDTKAGNNVLKIPF